MAKGAIAKQLIDSAGNVADKVADWLRKDKEAQQEAVTRLGLPANNTAKDRAKAMGFSDETYYHGSADNIDEFRPNSFFTDNGDSASSYARDRGWTPDGQQGSNVTPIRTRANNPASPGDVKKASQQTGSTDGYDLDATESWEFTTPRMNDASKDPAYGVINQLENNGYDSAKHWDWDMNNKEIDSLQIFNPANVRSPLAHFNPKMAGIGGAGAIMSGNLMADENNEKQRKPKMDDFFDRLLKMTKDGYVNDHPYAKRKDGYVKDLPYPDMRAKPNPLNAFIDSIAKDPKQNMPMAGTLNGRQLMQGNEKVNDFANWLESLKEASNTHQNEMRAKRPNPMRSEDPMNMGDFLIGNAPTAIKAHNENRPTKFWDDMDMMFLGVDALGVGAGAKAGMKGLGKIADGSANSQLGMVRIGDEAPTGAPKKSNDNLPPTRAFANDPITEIIEGKEKRITRASNEKPINSFLGSPAEDVVKYDELGNPIVTPKVQSTDINGNVYEQPADELNAPLTKGLSIPEESGDFVAKDLRDDIFNNKLNVFQEKPGSVTNNSAFADSQNLDAIAKAKKMSQDQKDAFVEQYGKTPEFDASKSEQKNWDISQRAEKANDANQNVGTGSNFDPKNVEDSVSTYKGKVDNNLVSDIKDPKHKKIIKSVKSTINYQRRAGDTSTGVDRSNIDYKMNKLVELLSDVENRNVVGVNKKRELEAKENLVNWINQNIEELQNKSMMGTDSGNLKKVPTKKSLEVLGEDKGTINRDKNTFREEREMDYGWNDVEDSPKSLLEPKTMNMDNKPPSMTITPDGYSPKLRDELSKMSLKDGYTVDSVLDYFRPLEADGIKPEQVYSSFNKFKHDMTGYDNAGKVLNGKEHKVYNYEMHSQFAQIMRDNDMPKVADYIMQMLENRGL